MRLVEQVWTTVTYILNWLIFNPSHDSGFQQSHLPGDLSPATVDHPSNAVLAGGPVFTPPSAHPGSDFTCDYSRMSGWQACTSSSDRSCWLKNSNGKRFDINTDYEISGPIGITRQYTVVLTDTAINADGIIFPEAKVFNNSFPGPWLQACWGDTLQITVINKLKYNGTSVHWHGIRQLLSNPADGVNGVTQCAIAPGDSFTYVWNATQYGSTWYHSHYSSQYADGVQGPITIHGPVSAPFDEAMDPTIMTDWGHNSAFEAEYTRDLGNPSILLNGRGNVTRYSGIRNTSPVPPPYQITFTPKSSTGLGRAKRYLLRLINTSFEATFIFTIDNHLLQVTTSDFVPIKPYTTKSVLIGIGQRYNVIVTADPQSSTSNPVPSDGNFWIRTYEAAGCDVPGDPVVNSERAGILRYNPSSQASPTSRPWTGIQLACSDEPYESLVPIVPWQVGSPANGREEFNLRIGGPGPGIPGFPLALFSFQEAPSSPFAFTPMQVDYGDPSIMHLIQSPNVMPADWVVIPENYKSTDWVYLFIAGNFRGGPITFGPHPIHLHGHDFAILQQSNQPLTPSTVNLKLDNPPRRDVALLPNGGFLVLAFKTDNPGNWLLHCHIARHASGGLALQILERQADAYHQFGTSTSPALPSINRVCKNWKTWFSQCSNWWSGCSSGNVFQGDSGI